MSFGQPLSKAEIRVCRLVARGLSNKEVADALGLKIPTIKCHLWYAYKKLGVRSRSELIAEEFDWEE
jgi:DNA-binding CsgD family transcriptional regulator